MAADGKKPTPDGEKISFQTLMKKIGFSDQEFD
jgi:hypothetical protein